MEAVRKAIEDYVAREVKRAVESCISIIEGRPGAFFSKEECEIRNKIIQEIKARELESPIWRGC